MPWPRTASLDDVEEGGDPFVAFVREELELFRRNVVWASRGVAGGMGGLFNGFAIERVYVMLRCGENVRCISGDKVVYGCLVVVSTAFVDPFPCSYGYCVDLVRVASNASNGLSLSSHFVPSQDCEWFNRLGI